jgi:hypothetical protein
MESVRECAFCTVVLWDTPENKRKWEWKCHKMKNIYINCEIKWSVGLNPHHTSTWKSVQWLYFHSFVHVVCSGLKRAFNSYCICKL